MTTAQRARLILSLGVLNLVLATIALGIGGVGLQQRNAASGQPPVAVVNNPSPSPAPTVTGPTGSSSQPSQPTAIRGAVEPARDAVRGDRIAIRAARVADRRPDGRPGVGTSGRGAGLHPDAHAAAGYAAHHSTDGRPDRGADGGPHERPDSRPDECADSPPDVCRDPEADTEADRSPDPTPDAAGDTRTRRADREARRRRQGTAALPVEGRPAAGSHQDQRPAQVVWQGQGQAKGQVEGVEWRHHPDPAAACHGHGMGRSA